MVSIHHSIERTQLNNAIAVHQDIRQTKAAVRDVKSVVHVLDTAQDLSLAISFDLN